MALGKSKVSIPLAEGIDTKVDPNQRPIGTLERLENAVFDEPGRLKKRSGYSKLETTLLSGSDISDIQRITRFSSELCAFDKTTLYSYSDSVNRWASKGTVSNIFPTSKSIVRNTYEQSNVDSLHVSGLDIYAWEDGRGGIRVSIIDRSTGNSVVVDEEITSSGIKPRVQSIFNDIYFLYVDGTSIKYRKVSTAKPSTIAAEVTAINGDVNVTNKIYDATSIDEKIFLCWNSTGATLKIATISEDETVSAAQEEAGESPTVAIGLSSDSSSRLLISYYDGSDVKVIVRSYSLTANLVAATSIETIANIKNVTISQETYGNYRVLYEQSAAASYNHLIKSNTIDLAASVGTPTTFIKSCGLASKILLFESVLYVAVIHESALQSTMFILNGDGEVVSKISPGLSGGLVDEGNLTKMSSISSTMFLLASQIKGRTVSEDNTLFSLLGVNSTALDFNSEIKYDNAKQGDNLHIAGGMIEAYDGKEVVEHGFHLFPENVTSGGTATTGGSISDGTYQYSAVYTWTDNRGQQHQSAPSIPLSVTLSGGTGTQTQTITIPTLRITEKSNVVVDLYRTEDSGTVFYKTTSVSSPNFNDKTADTIDIVDTLADSSLLSNEVLYTTGGVLDNIAAPSASIIEAFGGRIFLAGLEDSNKLQYSKIRTEGKPIEFNDTLTINVSSTGGDITGLATMDEKLVIFKEDAIFYLAGDGPNNLGEQDTFISPELISTDVGCVSQNSVVLMPEGLMFKSKKGIYLLSRSLGVQYIGSPIEDFNDLTVTAATTLEDKNIVVFITNAEALVYNYFVKKWTLYTNHRGRSAVSLNGSYHYVRSSGEIYRESEDYTDNGSHIKLKLETSWISFAGIQAYQRVYRMLILGDYKSAHKLRIKVAYNFLDAFIQEKLIDTSDFTEDSTYGGDSPYGTGSPYGGSGNQYQARVNMEKQKCQSVKVVIEDSQDSDFGEGLQISNLLFVVGVKRGEFKVTQARTYGTD